MSAPTARPSPTSATRAADSRQQTSLVLGRYRLHRRLGAGGFGTVWAARDERLDRDVAVKILPRERVMGGRFEREARAAARLAHPAIVMLYEAAIDERGAYLVSELVHGATLDELLDTGRLSDRDVVEIGIALCDALEHAHANGIVHRDVKPSNVLVPNRPLTPEQAAKLTDFGVARVIGGDSLTRTGDVVGTAAYMAPEQAEGRPTGVAADLYSLALVIYEGLIGVNPVCERPAGRRARRLGAHLPPLRRQRRDLPRELGQAIDLALRPRPGERGTIDGLRAALSEAKEHMADKPGVVASPWPSRRDPLTQPSERSLGGARNGVGVASSRESERALARGAAQATPWPARAIAGVATAALTAWLATHVPGGLPIAPAAAACLAGVLVLTLPRVGWIVLAGAVSGSLALHDHPGAALLVLVAMLIPLALGPRSGTDWPLSAGAPTLAALGLGGAWPALAARARTPWRRAALGITGWLWLVLAIPLANADLYISRWRGLPASSVWMASLSATGHQVLAPLLGPGMLAPAAVWGLAAVLLPAFRSRGSPALDCMLVTAWAGLVLVGTVAALGLGHRQALLSPGAAIVGALAGLPAALVPRWHRHWLRAEGRRTESRHSRSMDPR